MADDKFDGLSGRVQTGKHSFPSRMRIAQWRRKEPGKIWTDSHGREYGPMTLAAFEDTDESGETWWVHLPTQMLPEHAGETRMAEYMMDMPSVSDRLSIFNKEDPSLQFEAEILGYYEIAKWLRTATIVLEKL